VLVEKADGHSVGELDGATDIISDGRWEGEFEGKADGISMDCKYVGILDVEWVELLEFKIGDIFGNEIFSMCKYFKSLMSLICCLSTICCNREVLFSILYNAYDVFISVFAIIILLFVHSKDINM
jgi:hypothetical protein